MSSTVAPAAPRTTQRHQGLRCPQALRGGSKRSGAGVRTRRRQLGLFIPVRVAGEDIKDARHAPQKPRGGEQGGDDPALQLTHGACVGS